MSSHNWHEEAFFGIHYDLHANAQDTELGRELTAEHLRARLLMVQPDWIQVDCKGHPGYTSWPTMVGSTAPGVVQDQLRIQRAVTRELGIKLGVHYSGVWDTRAIELHPEWARVDAEGRPDPDITCRLSPYDEELMIPQMIEIIDHYDVDGFWVDGENWATRPCWCERCQAEFTRRTGHQPAPRAPGQAHWEEWLAFHRDLFVEHVSRYANAVHARKSGCLVCSNWMYTMRQPDPIAAPVDYLSGDFDWAWGAQRAAVEGRLLDGRGLSWDLMAWAFTKAGSMGEDPPWVMKPTLHLCQEVAEVLALGGAVMLYNQPQRTGWLTGWHQQTIAEVAAFCRARQAVCFRTQTASQAAILHLAGHYYAHNHPLFNYGSAVQPVEGALHALLENHISTDLLTEDAARQRMSSYQLIVVPEQTRLSPELVAALHDYAQNGGHVLLSGAHLATEQPALIGAFPRADGQSDEVIYLPTRGQATPAFGPWQAVQPMAGVEPWGHALAEQEIDKDATDRIVVTCRRVGAGSIIAVHGPLFANYFLGHYPLLRRFIGDLIARLDIPWQVTIDAPPRLELIVRHKAGKLLVNLVNRGAGEALAPHRVIVEELPPVQDVIVHVRRAQPPTTVTAIGATGIAWQYDAGMLIVRLPRVDIHAVLGIE